LCYALDGHDVLFTGDHVMGWSTSIISPPDGDMAAYMASLELLLERDDEVYWPTHGPAITEPKAHVRAFIAHREEREAQILECIDAGITHIDAMVPRMYAGLPEFMYPAAGRSVFAAVIHLVQQGRLRCEGPLRADAAFTRA
jgi:glyoxylase-like metal-dependent hydrolase (beta-lactamase superfamily II)